LKINPLTPKSNEQPTHYAMRVAEWYKSWQKVKTELGQYFTPQPVAEFMTQGIQTQQTTLRVLDAGAGMGILACAVCENVLANIELIAYEIDNQIADCLEIVLDYTRQWMSTQGRLLTYTIHRHDFILCNAHALALSLNDDALFDVVISNPPYLKISKADPRAVLAERIVHGQPNLYVLFMAVGGALLRAGGQFIFITPRSYMSGAYFQRFREFFWALMNITTVHLFVSRKDVFESVLQESMIIWAERGSQNHEFRVSSSIDSKNLHQSQQNDFVFQDLLGEGSVLHIPLSHKDFHITKLFQTWAGRLEHYGMAVSTGRVVAFRASQWIETEGDITQNHAPLLWLHNIQSMQWQWPVEAKPQYISVKASKSLLVSNQNYILMRRFSPKEGRRLTATPYTSTLNTQWLGLENHLNYIYRKIGEMSELEIYGLSIFLSSQWVDAYLRQVSGNTQIGATEIRNLPLPPLESIEEMGRLYLGNTMDIDSIVAETLGIYA